MRKAAIFVTLFCLQTAVADDLPGHYKPVVIEQRAQATSVFQSRMKEIDQLLSKKELSPMELETIHRLSYDLEAAVDFLEHENLDVQSNGLKSAVEALHRYSERQNVSETRRWYLKAQTAFAQATS